MKCGLECFSKGRHHLLDCMGFFGPEDAIVFASSTAHNPGWRGCTSGWWKILSRLTLSCGTRNCPPFPSFRREKWSRLKRWKTTPACFLFRFFLSGTGRIRIDVNPERTGQKSRLERVGFGISIIRPARNLMLTPSQSWFFKHIQGRNVVRRLRLFEWM